MNLYNDNDPNICAWVRQLILDGLVPPGEVSEKSITDLDPDYVLRFTQFHAFCGIAGWPYALQLAGVDPSERIWSGSAPCQPYSSAGSQLGDADPRNLWPAFFNLIRQCRPLRIIGEQVENAIGHGWLDNISADLEREGYACGAIVLGAHSVGAPHRRQRLYWVANAEHAQRRAQRGRNGCNWADQGRAEAHGVVGACGEVCELANAHGGKPGHGELQRSGRYLQRQENEDADRLGHTDSAGSFSGRQAAEANRYRSAAIADGGTDPAMEHAARERWEQRRAESGERGTECGRPENSSAAHADCARRGQAGCNDASDSEAHAGWARNWLGDGSALHPWRTGTAWMCTDGKQRLIEPSAFPLAHGVSGRVGLLRGYGNAIVPQAAAAFLQAALPQICQVGRADIRVNGESSPWDEATFG